MSSTFSQADNNERVIIQCPACQTRFAVTSGNLAKLEIPRFHCSRCDHVFTAEGTAGANEARQPVVDTNGSAPPEANHGDFLPPHVTRAELATEEIEDLFFDAPFEDAPPDPAGTPEKPFEPRSATMEPPSFSDHSRHIGGLQLPNEVDSTASAPHEIGSEQHEEFQTKFPFVADSDSMGGNFSEKFIDDPDEERFVPETPERILPRFSTRDLVEEEGPSFSSSIPERKTTQDSMPQFFAPPSVMGVRSAIGVSVVFLFAIALLGWQLSRNPETTQSFILSMVASAPHLPPNGLRVESARFETVTLDNGEEVRLIAGLIYNDTEQDFRDVQVEGQAFDQNGVLVGRSVISAGSGLAGTRIKSLSSEMIREIQGSESPKRFRLASGDSEEFSLALLDTDFTRASHFSARVFSVKESG